VIGQDLATPTPEEVLRFSAAMAALQLLGDDGTKMIEELQTFARRVALRYGSAIAGGAADALAAAIDKIEMGEQCSCHMYDCTLCQAHVTLDSLRTLEEAV